jgi:hypothetical protein
VCWTIAGYCLDHGGINITGGDRADGTHMESKWRLVSSKLSDPKGLSPLKSP